MNIISIDEGGMLQALERSNRNRLDEALRSQHLSDVPSNLPAIPERLRSTFRWARMERMAARPLAINLLYFCVLILISAGYYRTTEWIIAGIGCLAIIPFAAYAWWMTRKEWAEANIRRLLDSPFVFIHGEVVFENLPQMRQLDREIEELETAQQEAKETCGRIEGLAFELKEKLVLLGESTIDPQITALEGAKIIHEGIISKAEDLLIQSRRQRREQERIRQEIIARVELEMLRSQASSIAGGNGRNEGLQQLTDLEMNAHRMAVDAAALKRELQAVMHGWQTTNELSNL